MDVLEGIFLDLLGFSTTERLAARHVLVEPYRLRVSFVTPQVGAGAHAAPQRRTLCLDFEAPDGRAVGVVRLR